MDQLRCNHTLSEEQILRTESVKNAALLELERYDREIDRLRRLIDRLLDKRRSLSNDIDICHSILAPIHRLPGELLGQVFSECCALPSDVLDSEFASSMPIVPEQYQQYDMCGLRMNLSHVSSYWRTIALSTPALWSIFLIDLAKMNNSMLSLVLLHLERSAHSPLSFSIFDSANYEYDRSHKPDQSLIQQLLRTFLQNIPRWSCVSLDLEWETTTVGSLFEEVWNVESDLSSAPLPTVLQFLELTRFVNVYSQSGFPYRGFMKVLNQAPLLRAIRHHNELMTTDGRELPYHQLHYLDVLLNQKQALTVLSISPELRKCCLRVWDRSIDNPGLNTPRRIIDLSRLNTLEIFGNFQPRSCVPVLQTLFDQLTVPSLTTLSIKMPQFHQGGLANWPHSQFRDMLVRSSLLSSSGPGNCIQKLVLHNLRLCDDDLLAIFRYFPHLLELDMAGYESCSWNSEPGSNPRNVFMLSYRVLLSLTTSLWHGFDTDSEMSFLPDASMAPSDLANTDAPLLGKLRKLTLRAQGSFTLLDTDALLDLLESRYTSCQGEYGLVSRFSST